MDMTDPALAYPKARARVLDRIQRKADLAKQERLCRAAVKQRDKGRCVVPGCKEALKHLHHIVYRSQGGKWRSENVCSLCVKHHQLLHGGLITISGNADEHLTITGDAKYLKFRL
jgi:hypothetical protein